MVYALLQRKAPANSLQSLLGVYSSWPNAYSTFYNRYKQGRYPFTLGRFPYHDKGMFDLTVQQMDYNKNFIRIFESDALVVDIVRMPLDSQVK